MKFSLVCKTIYISIDLGVEVLLVKMSCTDVKNV